MRNTIKGFINHSFKALPFVNDTPEKRLMFCRALGLYKSGHNWRSARADMHAPEPSPLSPGFNTRNAGTQWEQRTPVMYGFSKGHMRNETWADEVEGSRINHHGWYTDEDCSRILRAFVFNLPHGRYGAGYYDSDTGEAVYLLSVFKDAHSAANAGDSEAERIADEEQTYNIRWNAAQKLRQDVKDCEERLRSYLSARNDKRTAARELAVMELDNLRDARKAAAEYDDIEGWDGQ